MPELLPDEEISEEHFHIFIVSEEFIGTRLDQYLTQVLPLDRSRSYLQGLIKKEKVSLNGKIVRRPSLKLKLNDRVELSVPPPETLQVIAQEIPLDICYEDAHLLVINKPAGMVVHPAAGHPDGTLVNALLHHCQDLSGIGGVLRPGIVHRLDRDTSGLLVVAKDDASHRGLATLFKEKPKDKLDRRYLAIVRGNLKEERGTIESFYGRHPTQRLRFTSRLSSGKKAITHFQVKERFEVATLVELRLETGRTHQIRVHLAEGHHPIIGDTLYGGKIPTKFPNFLKVFSRQALHAFRLHFEHPLTHEMIRCEQELPTDMAELLEQLRQKSR